jgi:integrase
MTYIGKLYAAKGLNSNEEGLVQIYISFSRSIRKVISTGVYVMPQFWDKVNSLVVNHPLATEFNSRINNIIRDVEILEAECVSQNTHFSPLTIEHYLSAGQQSKIFNEFYLSELNKQKTQPETYKDQLKTLNHLSNFNPRIKFQELNSVLVLKFDKYLQSLGHASSTIFFHHKNLKKYINLAVSYGYIPNDICKQLYKDIKLISPKSKRPFLSNQQVMKIYNASYSTERLRRVADRFVFACCTGLKVSDLSRVTPEKFDGTFLNIIPEIVSKTSGAALALPIKILFNGLPYEILCKYDMVLPKFIEPDYNQLLKIVANQANVPSLVSQVARHTFLTQIALQDNKVYSVMKLGGICSIETAMIYMNLAKEYKKLSKKGLDLI